MGTVARDIDEYIAGFSPDVQEVLEAVRAAIRAAAPDAEETIKYQMPTFTLEGNLIHFAAFRNHIGLYPAPAGSEELQKKLSAYRGAKPDETRSKEYHDAGPIPDRILCVCSANSGSAPCSIELATRRCASPAAGRYACPGPPRCRNAQSRRCRHRSPARGTVAGRSVQAPGNPHPKPASYPAGPGR
jgi:hypothetical protein